MVGGTIKNELETDQLHPLVVGGGMMGALHVRALLGRRDVPSLVLVEPDPSRRHGLAQHHGRLVTYPDMAAALAVENVNFAVVAVPVTTAAETIRVLLERGVPVLAEKPLTTSSREAHALAELARDRGLLLSVGYIERFNPAVEALRDELARGTAGEVYHVHARRLSPFPYRSGMAGVATDVATHDLDVLRFITDSVPVRVFAETDVRQGGGAEDVLCASLRYRSGVTGLVEANWLTPMKVRRLTVTTERGMFDLDYVTQDLWLHERASSDADWDTLGVMRGANEGRSIRFALDRREPLAVEHERFIEALVTGGPAPVGAEEAVETLAVAEAIVESGRTHQPVVPSRPAVPSA